MSRASEYAKAFKTSPQPPAFNAGSVMDPIAVVDRHGDLALNGLCKAEKVPALLRWLRETFEDAPDA